MTDDEFRKLVIQRLDVMICLLLDRESKEQQMPMASKIDRLMESGLSARDTADVIGKPVNYVTAVTARKRKSAKKRKKKSKPNE